MTSKERSDNILTKFRRLGGKRWSVGIIEPNERKESIMSAEEHAVKIREYTKLILRLLAGQKYAEIVPLLDMIDEHTFDIQTGK